MLLEKESSGMYFSGHMIDNYSNHIATLSVDSVSEILSDTAEDCVNPSPKYKDRQNVRVAGIITGKRTKAVKNGDTMAFITLEDRFSEIEVVVFARQYSKFSDEIFNENAVLISGAISVEDGEGAKILLSSVEPLKSNTDFVMTENKETKSSQRVFIKVKDINDPSIKKISRMALLYPGKTQVVIFSSADRKYSVLKDTGINLSDDVIARFGAIFGEENVVVK